ncbi:MAG: MBL fold metallo-hydrolase, partial [Bacteroidota bacterium]
MLRRIRFSLLAGAAILFALPLSGQNLPDLDKGQELLEIHHINIGQGAATLIFGPGPDSTRRSILIDCGDLNGPDGGAIVYSYLRAEEVDTLDIFIATHYDADHIGGLVTGRPTFGMSFMLGPNGVPGAEGDDDGDGKKDWLGSNKIEFDVKEFGRDDDIVVRRFIDRGTEKMPRSKTFKKYDFLTSNVGEKIVLDDAEDIKASEIDLGSGATLTCVAGNGYVRGKMRRINLAKSENERSLCYWLSYGGFDYLIGGDLIGKRGTDSGPEDSRLEYEVGRWMKKNGVELDVYNSNHHGANNTGEMAFLNLVKPEVAVISVGDNSHGHPHPDHLGRLIGSGVQRIYQTNIGQPEWRVSKYLQSHRKIAGTNRHVVIRSDGTRYAVNGDEYPVD